MLMKRFFLILEDRKSPFPLDMSIVTVISAHMIPQTNIGDLLLAKMFTNIQDLLKFNFPTNFKSTHSVLLPESQPE